ncbi:PepSY domain-containing protein [Streptosporangium saharense]|uniref:PepSY domain-containing protein n=1 Tax=Streptosporangium saharense TaxID=1706840 RepID=UPI00332DD703
MRNITRATIVTAGLALAVAGGGAAFAANPSPAPSSTSTSTEQAPAPGEAQAKIQRDAAVKIALDKVPGAQLTEAEFDGDETPTTWEIELRKDSVEHEFEIDATTGAILEHDQETGQETGDDD